MVSAGERKRSLSIIILLVAGCLSGCNTKKAQNVPTIEITEVPTAGLGGPAQMESIEGRVQHADPSDQIVLYARSGVWWLQPLTNSPYTQIAPNLTWTNVTHLGSEYAALLVRKGYSPASKLASLPVVGSGVLAVATAKGKTGSGGDLSEIRFGGYSWTAHRGVSDHGGEPYQYDAANVWTDENGYLHLRMGFRNGRWSCAEASLNRSLGYGTYKVTVQDSAHLRPSAVLGIFTWDARSVALNNEADIELSRWGGVNSENAQYVIQPFYGPDNLFRFNVPAGRLIHSLRWEPGRVSFRTVSRMGSEHETQISAHVFTAGVPTPGGERVHIDLYDFHHASGASQLAEEVVIESFEFIPAN